MSWTKSRHNKNARRLMRQVDQSIFEHREYAVKRIRRRACRDVLIYIIWRDLPDRSDGKTRSWKRFRKHQYKGK